MARKKEKKVVTGGTFEILHRGHKALLGRAFKLGQVTIGLTSNTFARRLKKRKVNDFQQRKRALISFIKKEFKVLPEIIKIEDKFGPTLDRDFDYIVVSPETYKTALLINKKRRKAGKKPMKVVKIKFVLGKNGKPISASKILKNKK
jgi:pantetheine-phosphate adenylyltransferase